MGKFFKWLFLGALIGVGVAVAIWLLSLCFGLLSCTCAILTCDLNGAKSASVMSGSTFTSVLLLCTAGGAGIGAIYGMVLGLQERNARTDTRQQENYNKLVRELETLSSQQQAFSEAEEKSLESVRYILDVKQQRYHTCRSRCEENMQQTKTAAQPREKERASV